MRHANNTGTLPGPERGLFGRVEKQPVVRPGQIIYLGTPLWQLRLDGRQTECQVVRTSFGFEAHCLFDGRLLASYQFSTLTQVLRWAEQRRTDMETRGWSSEARRVADVSSHQTIAR